jgi:hypothetical protein
VLTPNKNQQTMALEARRFHGKPLLQPNYNFRDVPWCNKDLSGSTISIVTERQHFVDAIAEITLLCNEAVRRKKQDAAAAAASTSSNANNALHPPPVTTKTTKPLSIEYIFDRIDTDDPLWGLMVRTDTPMSLKGRASNIKSSPNWKRGMLQGFITMTTFTNWQSSFRFDSLHEMAFSQDEDVLEEQMKRGLRRYDADGKLAMELEATVKGGNPHLEGIVYPRIAEVSLFGGLGCGKVRDYWIASVDFLIVGNIPMLTSNLSCVIFSTFQQLLRLLIEHLECLKATARQNYDYIVLQATENSIPFYESMGFTRVGCVQGKAPSPNTYCSNPVIEYHTKKNGETPSSIAKDFGVDVWDVVFLNRPLYSELMQKSWLKLGTTIFVPDMQGKSKASVASASAAAAKGAANLAPKWHIADENETPRGIAKKFNVNFGELLQANKKRHPELLGNSKLLKGTRIQISRFDIDEGDTIAYSHWTFPDAEEDEHDPSYMMAMKLNRRKGLNMKERPVADSLAVSIQPYNPESFDIKDLLLQPQQPAQKPLAPIFTKKPVLQEPTKPKRPVTSYAHFTTVSRTNMAGELEGLSMVEINKILSEKWRSFTEKDKLPFQLMYEESKAVYEEAMKKYECDMMQFKSGSSNVTSNGPVATDTSLLEKVVKLKSPEGITGASKFEYYYVLTFIPDLHWVHLIPMRKVGVFGSKYPDSCGRPIWMIVGEEEGKEIDSTAALCKPVTALTMKNSADADKEQWDIYDNGELPPPPRFTPKVTPAAISAAVRLPGAPVRPKKPATSFAFFCADAKNVLKEEITPNMHISERTRLVAERWKALPEEKKQKYRDQVSRAQEKYAKDLKKYNADLSIFQRENPGVDVSVVAVSPKKPTSSKKIKPLEVSSDTSNQRESRKRPLSSLELEADETIAPKSKRGRPKQDTSATDDTHTVQEDRQQPKSIAVPRGRPGKNDIILSLNDDRYKYIMWEHFNSLGMTRDAKRECDASDEAFAQFKQITGESGKFFKRNNGNDHEVNEDVARESKF